MAGGMTVVNLSDADHQKFDADLSAVAQQWADAADKRGRKGSEVLKDFRDAVKQAR
jgi:hypothetical protein